MAANTGTHVGSLWDANGNLLASATFANESASGWQQVSLSKPVSIWPNTTYVISYYAPNGHYALTSGYFYPAPSPAPDQADARRLPFKDEFDLAVSLNALHWIPDQNAALRSIYSALVPGGRAQFRLVTAGARQSLESVVEETRTAPEWKAYFKNFQDPYLRLTPDEYVAVAERNGFRVLRVNTQDHVWDFGSRAAFANFSAVGLVAWTDRLPAAERPKFVDDVLDRYHAVAASRAREENTFKFYQTDFAMTKPR